MHDSAPSFEIMADGNRSALVSVVIPVYNVSEYLDQCLESVTRQSYHNIEILLINRRWFD